MSLRHKAIEQRALVPICRGPGMQEAQLSRPARLTISLAITGGARERSSLGPAPPRRARP